MEVDDDNQTLEDDNNFARALAAPIQDLMEGDDDDEEGEGAADEFAGLSKREQKKLRQKKRKEISRAHRKERVKRRKESEQEETGLVTEKAVEETTYHFSNGTAQKGQIPLARF